MKKYLKVILKIALTCLALFIVFQKIDLANTFNVMKKIHIGWLMLAILAFNISKTVSAFRFARFFKQLSIQLAHITWIKLTYIGMFYNLFLPGGIGGDGYKVYLLKKSFKDTSLKKIVSGALLDRISGLNLLVFLSLILITQTSTYYLLSDPRINIWLFVTIAVYLPISILILRRIFFSFKKAFPVTDLQSLFVQIFQLLCAFFLLKGLGVTSFTFDYLELFLISSVAAVLPLTIGGVGIRELVFVYGYKYLVIDKNLAIAFTLTFFLVTVVSSLVGTMLSIDKDLHLNNDQNDTLKNGTGTPQEDHSQI